MTIYAHLGNERPAFTRPEQPEDTPFINFWAAVNAALKANGQPELGFGPARRLFQATVADAHSDRWLA